MRVNKMEFIKSKAQVTPTPGDALKMLRQLQGLSQNELAQLSGISQSNLSALEGNTRQMGRERALALALALAKALKVHPAVLLFPDFDIADVT